MSDEYEISDNIYFDYASATPLAPEVFSAMQPFFLEEYGNAGSQHQFGRNAKIALTKARKAIASHVGSNEKEIIFTGSGTESNNLGIIGFVRALVESGRDITSLHGVTSTIEHPSVLECFAYLEKQGMKVTYIGVDEMGFVNVADIRTALTKDTVLVSIMMVNNEMGAIQPIAQIGKEITSYRKENKNQELYFHTDASQAGLFIDINVQDLQVDMLTLDAQKVYGPKGVGLLYRKVSVPLKPVLIGGNQEFDLRPGTENIPGIVGFSAAMDLVSREREKEIKRITSVRDYCIDKLQSDFKDIVIHGPKESHATERIANNVNFSIHGIEGEFLVIALSKKGFSCGTRSACASEKGGASYVITAMTGSLHAQSSLRLSFGRGTTVGQIDLFLEALKSIVQNFDK